MCAAKTELDKYIAEQVQKIKGVYFPVKTGLLRRRLTKKAACKSLYPNPEDEFSMPDIGPSYSIISNYERQFLDNIQRNIPYTYPNKPIIVEKLHPDGYMLINGHHRWAAALRIGQAKIPVQIVNLMHETDVKEILQNSNHVKCASFDLDEVLIRGEEDPCLEKPLPFPWNCIYKIRIRRGVPALFHCLEKNGYDIWLYSAQYHSADAVQDYFRRYHVQVDGVISAVGRRIGFGSDGKKLEQLLRDKYRSTLHTDNDMVLYTCGDAKESREFELSGAPDAWSQEVMDVIDRIEKEEADQPK